MRNRGDDGYLLLLCLLLGAQGWVVCVRDKRLPIRKLITSTAKAISTPSATPKMWARQFDDPKRDAWQKPDAVLDALQLPAPRGCRGRSRRRHRIFQRADCQAGPERKVFAADIEPDMVRYLGERAHREHLSVLQPVRTSADAANLPEPVDLVLVVDTYHHIDNRSAYFARLGASLRPNGRLAIIDFKLDAPDGPPVEFRIAPEKVTAELEAAGYRLVASHPFLPRQYFLVFQAKTS